MCSHEIKRIPTVIADLDTRTGSVIGCISLAEEAVGRGIYNNVLSPIGTTIASAVTKTVMFIKRNWKQLLAYIFAWGLIVSCTGLMYGFEAVALPLTIGLGCGLAFGIITGILTVKVFDDKNQHVGSNTLWDLVNQGIEKLDPNGTRQIVLAVVVTVILASAVVFPYVVGAAFGIFIGNQLATKAGQDRNLGRDPLNDRREQEKLKYEVAQMRVKLEELQKLLDKVD